MVELAGIIYLYNNKTFFKLENKLTKLFGIHNIDILKKIIQL